MKQEIKFVEDLETLIDSAMCLAESMAQQKADIKFEFISKTAYGEMVFNPKRMTDRFQLLEDFDPQMHHCIVSLTLAPGLMKYGTTEGTDLEACTQLLEAEVETKTFPRNKH